MLKEVQKNFSKIYEDHFKAALNVKEVECNWGMPEINLTIKENEGSVHRVTVFVVNTIEGTIKTYTKAWSVKEDERIEPIFTIVVKEVEDFIKERVIALTEQIFSSPVKSETKAEVEPSKE